MMPLQGTCNYGVTSGNII